MNGNIAGLRRTQLFLKNIFREPENSFLTTDGTDGTEEEGGED
jgi:hypothetical protein